MKKIFYMAVAAIAVLGSCEKENNPVQGGDKEVVKFTASIENNDTNDTKATLNVMTPNWEVGDVISIDGHEYTADASGPSSTFTGTGATEATHHAYFPASLYNGGTPTLPAVINETWADGRFNMPMYAESTTSDLEFKNLCGVLKITVPSTQAASVKSITVSSKNCATSGAFTVSGNAAVLSNSSAVANTTTVIYTDAVATTAGGTVFYVAIPAQTYQELEIEVYGSGVSKVMTTKAGTDITVARNKIYPINFADNTGLTHPYVVMAGKKWATTNVSTLKFAWGEVYGNRETIVEHYSDAVTMDWTGVRNSNYLAMADRDNDYSMSPYKWSGPSKYRSSSYGTLEAADDAATFKWGAPWRMPTNQEFLDLLEACGGSASDSKRKKPSILDTSSPVTGGIYFLEDAQTANNFLPYHAYTGGLLFVDMVNPSKYLFFEAEGEMMNYNYRYDYGSKGVYWTSSLYDGNSSYAYSMVFYMLHENMNYSYLDIGGSGNKDNSNYAIWARYDGGTVRAIAD